MAITSQIKQWVLKTLPGMNNKLEDLELQSKWVVKAQNCRFEDEPGTVVKRGPLTKYNTTELTTNDYGTRGLFRYYLSSGVAGQSVIVHDNGTTDQRVYKGADAGGAPTLIRTLGSSSVGKQMSFEVYKDILIGSNGYANPWCYDGADDVTWELGSCKAVLSANTGTVLEDCEDAWNEQVIGNVTASADSSDKQVGSASAKFVVGAAFGTGVIGSEVISEDFSDMKYLHAWVKSSVELDAGDWQIVVDDTANCASPTHTIDIPALAAATWTRIALDISAWTEASAISIGLNQAVDKGAMSFWIDDVRTSQLDSAAYYYAVGFCTEAAGAGTEYLNGAVSNTVTTTASYTQVSLSHIPLGDTTILSRKVYRTEGGGSTLKLLATINDNSTTTYTDDISDASLGATMGAVTDDMPVGNLLKLHRDRLFISGDPSHPNRIYYSAPLLPWFILQTNNTDYMDIAPDDGDVIMGIPIQLGAMVCIKKKSIRKLHIASPVSGYDPANWYADDPIVFDGTPARWSIDQTPYGVIYLGWDHWKVFDGATSKDIIDEFDTSDILPAEYDNVVVKYLTSGILLAAYADATIASQKNNRLMRYNFKRQALSYDTVNVNCISEHTGDSEAGEVLLGASDKGYVYKTEINDYWYALENKSDVEGGSYTADKSGIPDGIFVGGTETAPYIEMGGLSSASDIPDNVCILWDDPDTSPDTGTWTELTTKDNTFIKIKDAASGTTAATTHSNGTATVINWVAFRVFYAATSGISELPTGAIVFWDQVTTPTGFVDVGYNGYYLKVNSDLTSPTGQDIVNVDDDEPGGAYMDQKVSFRLIKKVGEQDTWDAESQYIYCLVYDSGDSWSDSNGFADVSSAYEDHYLAAGDDEPTVTDGGDTAGTVDLVNMEITTHSYSGAGDGIKSHDGDADTSMQSAGAGARTVISTHMFNHVYDVDSVLIKASVSASGTGTSSQIKTQYTTVENPGSGDWTSFAGGDKSGGGLAALDTTLTALGITGVWGVRAWTYATSTDDNTSCAIYEIQAWGNNGDSCTFKLAKAVLGKMVDYNDGITNTYTSGTWTSPSMEINTSALKKLYWNESITDTVNDDVKLYVRLGATKATCEAASWSAAFTDPNGSDISGETANVWLQYKIVLSGDDSTGSNPRVYFVNGYLVRFSYEKGVTYISEESSGVEWIYEVGFRDFDEPMVDKIMKKLIAVYQADVDATGSLKIYWRTDVDGYDEFDDNKVFTIDLGAYPKRWEAFFPSTATGRQLDLKFYKYDLEEFKLKGAKGLYTPEPILI